MRKALFYLSLVIIVYILTFMNNVPDYDLWARLAVGSIFFQTGHVLKHDIFSYLPTKDLWVDHEWGSGVVFYLLTKYFGDTGLFALKAVILLAIFLLVIEIIKLQTNKYPGVLYLILISFSIFPGIYNLIRCQMFTYLFFTLWLYVLERIKRGENKIIWIFPVTMLFWANMHGGFIAGIGLVLIYAVGELVNRKTHLKYFVILILILLVTLFNPYGLDLWIYIIEAVNMPRPYIWEWNPISLSGPVHIFEGIKIHILTGFMLFVLFMLFVSIKLLFQKEKFDWTRIILVVALLYFGVKHQRHTIFFIIVVSGLFYQRFVDLFNPLRRFTQNFLTDKVYKAWSVIKYIPGYVLLGGIFIYSMPFLSDNIIVDPFTYSVGSLEFIKQNGISGNLATTYGWGSYAFWKLYPQCKVLIDGRYEEVYSNDVYAKAMQLSEHEKNWQDVLKEYNTDILMLPKRLYSRSDLLSLADWKIVYIDEISVLLLPKSKIKSVYIYPNYKNPLYWKEDLSKEILMN